MSNVIQGANRFPRKIEARTGRQVPPPRNPFTSSYSFNTSSVHSFDDLFVQVSAEYTFESDCEYEDVNGFLNVVMFNPFRFLDERCFDLPDGFEGAGLGRFLSIFNEDFEFCTKFSEVVGRDHYMSIPFIQSLDVSPEVRGNGFEMMMLMDFAEQFNVFDSVMVSCPELMSQPFFTMISREWELSVRNECESAASLRYADMLSGKGFSKVELDGHTFYAIATDSVLTQQWRFR